MYKVPGAGGAVGAGAGALAFTGANVTGWVIFGVILVVAGGFAMFAGRRRRHRLATSGDDTAS